MRILIILRRLIIYNRRLTRLKKFVCMLFLLTGMAWLYVQPVQAQKKEIAAAKDLVKAGKNLDQVQQNMEKLLLDSANRTNRKIWAVLYDAVRKQYEQGNEQLYLKQKYDTAKLFSLTRQLFVIAEGLGRKHTQP